LLRKLKELSDWDKRLPKHHRRGVAQWKFFGCQCGQVIEVGFDPAGKSIKIEE